jgi:hypothetical protein
MCIFTLRTSPERYSDHEYIVVRMSELARKITLSSLRAADDRFTVTLAFIIAFKQYNFNITVSLGALSFNAMITAVSFMKRLCILTKSPGFKHESPTTFFTLRTPAECYSDLERSR